MLLLYDFIFIKTSQNTLTTYQNSHVHTSVFKYDFIHYLTEYNLSNRKKKNKELVEQKSALHIKHILEIKTITTVHKHSFDMSMISKKKKKISKRKRKANRNRNRQKARSPFFS